MDQFDPWQVVPRQVFIPYSRLSILLAFVVVSHVGSLRVARGFRIYTICSDMGSQYCFRSCEFLNHNTRHWQSPYTVSKTVLKVTRVQLDFKIFLIN